MECPYWVIEGSLAGSCAPRSENDVDSWYRFGIRAVVSLIEDWEFDELGFPKPRYVNALRIRGMELLHVPTRDGYAPDVDTLMVVLRWINGRVSSGRPVLVHCNAGVGRSPTVLMSYLILYRGFNFREAFNILQSINPEVSLSYQQIKVLEEVEALSRGQQYYSTSSRRR